MNNRGVLRHARRVAWVVVFGVGLPASGWANSTGLIGASGKNGGFFCRNCHTGGSAPTVAFDGPAVVAPGAIATFRFTVASTAPAQTAAGINVAASDGSLETIAEQGLRLELGELTHVSPKGNDGNGQALFEFTWRAPQSAGVYTLFGAGTSVNHNDLRTGDAAARTTHDVFVGVPTYTPVATDTPTPTATPTATPVAAACVGDCGGDGEVTVDEVITGVNMALGVTPPSACPQFDSSGDGQVTVDEILQAVNIALTGCPLP